MINEEILKKFFAVKSKVLSRVPLPIFKRYIHHNTWHVCKNSQDLVFDNEMWIEILWDLRDIF